MLMLPLSLVFSAPLLQGVLALSTRFSHHTVVESRTAHPNGWSKRSFSSADHQMKRDMLLPVRINLAQRNEARSEELLHETSSPDSKKYGQHMSVAEIMDLFAPSVDAVDLVSEWLIEEGFKGHVEYYKSKGVREERVFPSSFICPK